MSMILSMTQVPSIFLHDEEKRNLNPCKENLIRIFFHSLHIKNSYYAIHYFLFGDGTNFKLLHCLWFLENFKECVK